MNLFITDEAHRTIVGSNSRNLKPGERQPDGYWKIQVTDTVYRSLMSHQYGSENISDIIIRLSRGRRS
jgi:hypothetical protein